MAVAASPARVNEHNIPTFRTLFISLRELLMAHRSKKLLGY
jgi:hypothetical protein